MLKLRNWISAILILSMAGGGCLSAGLQSEPKTQEALLIPQLEKLIEARTATIVLLYGYICVGCPIGKYIYSVKDRDDVVFVVPSKYRPNEVENLRRAFSLKGKVIRSDDANIQSFVIRIADQMNIDETRRNLILDIKDKKILKTRYY